MATDDEIQAAKDKIQEAVQAFNDLADEGDFVVGWVLIAHKQTINTDGSNQSYTSTLVPTGQSFISTRGLIEIARDMERVTG